MPKVFIIIINFNGWSDTKECLESLGQVDYDNFEVILLDNASKGDYRLPTTDYRFKIQTIYNKENLGFAGANNQGIKLALENKADYVLLLNNDTTVDSDFLSKLVEEAENDESAGIVGPLISFYDDRNKIWSAGGKITNHSTRGELIAYQEIDEGEYQVAEQVDYISGTCLLIKVEVIKKIGLISEDYFLYYEDTDWCVRADKAGWRCLLVPQSKIYHKASKSTQEFSYPYIYYHSRNGLMFSERFGNKFVVLLLSVWIFLKQILKLAVGYKRNWARPVLRGVWDFWVGKKGKIEGYN
ncbi:glycosyltransferase family 2 protein [Patescibacteria group bacterium]|nr:glycosyltransferase family 2 protein [Patescibacteria group bacterium]MBU2220130.1 glycosyltransferase family 2 protein [Patescibacteria group bacterium]MBU2264892.1 glycosyltransferase family 2 protein [Patescibacteria group bacterium]